MELSGSRARLCALITICIFGAALASGSQLRAAESSPLTLDTQYPLGQIAGRIDHLAFDSTRQRLYVAELGNNSIGILDVKAGRVLRTVKGFDEPQGIAYEPSTDSVYVANAGDGSVRIFRAEDFAPLGRIPLGDDADNVRVDRRTGHVYVGYGNGALAVIDSRTRTKIADVPLKGHPESFQLETDGPNVFVNIPDAAEITVVNRETQKVLATWPTAHLRANFPLALEGPAGRVLAIFRNPARLAVFDARRGTILNDTSVCTDSDDVFVDTQRGRAYVICGEGFTDTFALAAGNYVRLDHIATVAGARTGLFVPELDRLFVVVRAHGENGAAIWAFRTRNP
jgi:YVTN family beta-propeller protein